MVLTIAAVLSGCAGSSRWQTTRRPDVLDAAALLASDGGSLNRGDRPEEVPIVPVRKRLRPCCGFGSGLRVRVGAIKIPGISIDNIRSSDDIGSHTYDAGQSAQSQLIGSEKNGLVYTCRGGFIDIAHVRDYADWALYLATEFGRHLETGTTVEIPTSEGGIRRIELQPIDPELVQISGRRKLAAALATWAAFRLSVWHEIATWYGWSSFSVFSERASAFSPEDLYSNLLGAKIASAIVTSGNDLSEALFNDAVDAWLAQSLDFLGAVPAEVGEDAMGAIDGDWWDSTARLPDAHLVRMRNFEVGVRLAPWLVKESKMNQALVRSLGRHCGEDRSPHVLRNPARIPTLQLSDLITLSIELDDVLAKRTELRRFDGRVADHDFDAIIEEIRQEAVLEFGPDAAGER